MTTANQAHILIVEDDREIRQDLAECLKAEGFSVVVAERGRQAIDILNQHIPDLAIIDLYLPDMKGFAVCSAIKRYADIPIIILTYETQEDIKVQALDQFAEDYITKPYSRRELVARVGRVLRRFQATPETNRAELIIDDDLRINFAHHWVEVHYRDTPPNAFERISLTPTESRILYFLVTNAPRILTIEALLARVWTVDDAAFPEGLRVHIRRLRMKIEPDPANPRYVITARKLGYRLGVIPRGAKLVEQVL